MQIIIRIIVPILIPAVIGLLLTSIKNHNSNEVIKNMTKNHVIIRLPKVYIWVGCFDISFFSSFLLMTYFSNEETASIWVRVLFCIFILLGIVIILQTQVWKIEIFRNEDYFLCRAFFKTHKIRYSECVNYKVTANSLVLKTDKQKFYIDTHATNSEFLLALLTKYKVKEIK